jgi:hypothetical protein
VKEKKEEPTKNKNKTGNGVWADEMKTFSGRKKKTAELVSIDPRYLKKKIPTLKVDPVQPTS